MTEEEIKEELSNQYIGILASFKGFMLDKPRKDKGIDFELSRVSTFTNLLGHKEVLPDSKAIHIQMKCTTMSRVSFTDKFVSYPLEARTYDKLVFRNNNPHNAPLILILFVLPSDKPEWVEVEPNRLIFRHSAYWFLPDPKAELTANASSIQVKIPLENRFVLETIPDLFNKFHP